MYYSFYMNERMLLDEWKYYQRKGECNWLLKRTLMNDNTRTAEEKIEFYFANRRIKWEYPEFFKEQAEKVKEYLWDMKGRFESEAEMEYFLDHRFINDGYEVMDYGHDQKLFNMYRRYIELEGNANETVIKHLSFEPKKNAKFREHKFILINDKDIKFIREARKYTTLTVPQIEVLFGIIFFCRMHDSERAQLNTEFKKKQFIGCFETATIKDLEYVVSHVYGITEEDGDIVYPNFKNAELDDKWIAMTVTRFNNKLNLSKVARQFIKDITDKRYCAMCLKPFKPTNNRQQVCDCCKPKADGIKAKLRKTKQRYIEKHGKDACCGTCTNCTQVNCSNWWEYWYSEFDTRICEYKDKHQYPFPRRDYDVPEDVGNKILDELLYDIKNAYTDEEKSEILPWDIAYKFKRI